MEITFVPTLAHGLIGFYFAFFGLWNAYHWHPTLTALREKKLPLPACLLSIAIAWEIIAGFLILCNIFIAWAALSLIPFTLIASLIIHPFWSFEGDLRTLNFIIFTTNMTVTMAAMLLLLASSTGIHLSL